LELEISKSKVTPRMNKTKVQEELKWLERRQTLPRQ
jgi:hypothetical protein